MGLKLTPTQLMLLDLLINNAIRFALAQIASMTEDELKEAINKELYRKADLMERLKNG